MKMKTLADPGLNDRLVVNLLGVFLTGGFE